MKNLWKYIILFVLFLLTMLVFYIPFRMDTYVNYGFSYGIVKGQIPYNEFNMIVPLFSPFLYSIFLLFSKSIFVYYLEQAFLLILFCFYLFKLMDKKAWIVVASLFCPYIFHFAYCMFPGYNFLILLELLLLIYLEENKKEDSIIGVISGLTILTKHSMGIFIFLVTIFYPLFKNRNRKSSFRRLLFGFIPIFVFLIYLFCSKSFMKFIDYCLLGMGDFRDNFQFSLFYFILIVISLVVVCILLFKSKNRNISYFYLLSYLPVVYPLVESYHVSLFLFFFFIVLVYNIRMFVPRKINLYSFIVIAFFISSYVFLGKDYFKIMHIYSFHNFPVEFISSSMKKDYDAIISFSKEHDSIIFVGDPSKTIFLNL